MQHSPFHVLLVLSDIHHFYHWNINAQIIYGKFEHLKILIHLTIFHIGYCQIAKFQEECFQ